ncbi:MAG: hypothetical protein HY059_24360 [Proteobacteria bacterium]|nr:hypothetical protein [Pseudomonadota bacterium]
MTDSGAPYRGQSEPSTHRGEAGTRQKAAGRLSDFRRSFLVLAPIALWVIDVAGLATTAPWLRTINYGVLGLYLLAAIPGARRTNLLLGGAMAVVATVLLIGEAPLSATRQGLDFAVLFGAFLLVLQLVRATVETMPKATTTRALFETMTESERRVAIISSTHLLGGVLSLGSAAVVRPLLPASNNPHLRREQALANIRGMCTSIYWSPFTVGIAFIFYLFPNLPPWQVFGLGACIAALAIVISILGEGGRAGLAALAATVRAFRPVLLPLVSVALAVVVVTAVSGLSTLQATILVMPLFALLQLLLSESTRAERVWRLTVDRVGRSGDDLVVFTAAVVLSGVIVASPEVTQAAGTILPASLPLPAIILVMMVVGLALSLLGLNAMLCATVLLALVSGTNGVVPDLVMALILLYAWSCSSSLSLASLGVLTVAQLYGVAPQSLIWTRNLVFLGGFGVILAVLLYGLALLIRL